MVLPSETMPGQDPTSAEVIEALREAGRCGMDAHRRCQGYLRQLGYDITDVEYWLSDCEEEELHKHGPDDDHERAERFWVAVLKIFVEGETVPFYVKVVFHRPNLDSPYLLSFKPWQ